MLLFEDFSPSAWLEKLIFYFPISRVLDFDYNSIKLPANAPVSDEVEGRLAWVKVTCCGEISLCLVVFPSAGSSRKLESGNSKALMFLGEHCDIPPDILIKLCFVKLRAENLIRLEFATLFYQSLLSARCELLWKSISKCLIEFSRKSDGNRCIISSCSRESLRMIDLAQHGNAFSTRCDFPLNRSERKKSMEYLLLRSSNIEKLC